VLPVSGESGYCPSSFHQTEESLFLTPSERVLKVISDERGVWDFTPAQRQVPAEGEYKPTYKARSAPSSRVATGPTNSPVFMKGTMAPKPTTRLTSAVHPVFRWVDTGRCLRLARRHASNRRATPSFAQHIGPDWEAPKAITSWRRGVPLELLRYAVVNWLKADIEYRAENGRWGSRRVELYLLRYTQDGILILFVVNDN
jgi:hypothetical protein